MESHPSKTLGTAVRGHALEIQALEFRNPFDVSATLRFCHQN